LHTVETQNIQAPITHAVGMHWHLRCVPRLTRMHLGITMRPPRSHLGIQEGLKENIAFQPRAMLLLPLSAHPTALPGPTHPGSAGVLTSLQENQSLHQVRRATLAYDARSRACQLLEVLQDFLGLLQLCRVRVECIRRHLLRRHQDLRHDFVLGHEGNLGFLQ